jgi:hypothetical protein
VRPWLNTGRGEIVDLYIRLHFANVWLNEEWYNDMLQKKENPAWVSTILLQATLVSLVVAIEIRSMVAEDCQRISSTHDGSGQDTTRISSGSTSLAVRDSTNTRRPLLRS